MSAATGAASPTADPRNVRERLLRLIERHRSGQADEAIRGYREILEVEPAQFDARRLLGAALLQRGSPQQALPEIERALELRSDMAEVWALKAVALGFLGRHQDAVASYERALALRPGTPSFRMNLGMLHLLLGRLESGWDGWEMRLQPMGASAPRMAPGVPVWDGIQPLAGKTLLVVAEQGLGDAIQFCRYVPLLAQRGARVLLTVPPPLRRLIASLPGVAHMIDDGETVSGFDMQCLLLSLPHRFRTTLATIPAVVPYLTPAPERVSWWREHLGAAKRPRLGIAYCGNPNHGNDRQRSIPVSRFEALRSLDAELHLLHPRMGDEDLPWLRQLGIVDHQAQLHDFSETAALASCMDAIVSVDTAVAHLAGALALPLMLLLPAVPDWRWLLDRDDSPWYPSARLFRQTTAGDWDEPLRRVAEALRDRLQAQTWYLRAGEERLAGDQQAALASCERALALEPGHQPAATRRAIVLAELCRFDEAFPALREVLARQLDDAGARYNLGTLNLMTGRLRDGWEGYEWRKRLPGFAPPPPLDGPMWDGVEPLTGRTLLLISEQGQGDTIQFCRFAPLLAQRAARVKLIVQPALSALLQSLSGVDVSSMAEAAPGFDVQCCLLSVAQALGTTLETIPAQVPYLSPPPERLQAWRDRLGSARRPRIGLACSGSPKHGNDRNRSIALRRFEALSWLDAELHLIQNDLRDDDLPWLARLGVVDHRAQLHDFAEAAALAACMDAIVSVDTAAAHLAGALNLPLLLLLPAFPDWRWMLDRDDSPWYPSARLFRQTTPGDWDEPLRRVADALGAGLR